MKKILRVRVRGFSLIELIICIAVLGIMASIAYPSYLTQITRARRADGFAAIQAFSSAMERYFTVNGTYLGAAKNGLNTGPPQIPTTFKKATAPLDGNDVYYNLTIHSASDVRFTLRATPAGSQANDGIIEISSTGRRGWDKNKDGDTTDTGEDDW